MDDIVTCWIWLLDSFKMAICLLTVFTKTCTCLSSVQAGLLVQWAQPGAKHAQNWRKNCGLWEIPFITDPPQNLQKSWLICEDIEVNGNCFQSCEMGDQHQHHPERAERNMDFLWQLGKSGLLQELYSTSALQSSNLSCANPSWAGLEQPQNRIETDL